jgi:hypothetical protein
MSSLSLANDEYAAALLLTGSIDLALGLLANSGDTALNADDVMPRLQAGTAALAARGLVRDGQTLSQEVAPIVQIVARPAFTLYLRKTVADVDEGLALHCRGDAIVSQKIEAGTHTLTPVESLDAATPLAATFYGVDATSSSGEPFSLPADVVRPLIRASNADERAAALEGAAIAGTQAAFTADYESAAARGGFLRVDYAHGHPTTRAGASVVVGPKQVWILRRAPAGMVQIVHATLLTLHEELYSLSRL